MRWDIKFPARQAGYNYVAISPDIIARMFIVILTLLDCVVFGT